MPRIAEQLFPSPKTVEVNLARIYRKLDIRSCRTRRTAGQPQTKPIENPGCCGR